MKTFSFESVQALSFDALDLVWNAGFELVRNAELENAFDSVCNVGFEPIRNVELENAFDSVWNVLRLR